MRIKLYFNASPEYLYDKAKDAGLSDQAADYFRHAEEMALSLKVNPETGEVINARVVGDLETEIIGLLTEIKGEIEKNISMGPNGPIMTKIKKILADAAEE